MADKINSKFELIRKMELFNLKCIKLYHKYFRAPFFSQVYVIELITAFSFAFVITFINCDLPLKYSLHHISCVDFMHYDIIIMYVGLKCPNLRGQIKSIKICMKRVCSGELYSVYLGNKWRSDVYSMRTSNLNCLKWYEIEFIYKIYSILMHNVYASRRVYNLIVKIVAHTLTSEFYHFHIRS